MKHGRMAVEIRPPQRMVQNISSSCSSGSDRSNVWEGQDIAGVDGPQNFMDARFINGFLCSHEEETILE